MVEYFLVSGVFLPHSSPRHRPHSPRSWWRDGRGCPPRSGCTGPGSSCWGSACPSVWRKWPETEQRPCSCCASSGRGSRSFRRLENNLVYVLILVLFKSQNIKLKKGSLTAPAGWTTDGPLRDDSSCSADTFCWYLIFSDLMKTLNLDQNQKSRRRVKSWSWNSRATLTPSSSQNPLLWPSAQTPPDPLTWGGTASSWPRLPESRSRSPGSPWPSSPRRGRPAEPPHCGRTSDGWRSSPSLRRRLTGESQSKSYWRKENKNEHNLTSKKMKKNWLKTKSRDQFLPLFRIILKSN